MKTSEKGFEDFLQKSIPLSEKKLKNNVCLKTLV